MTEVFICGVPSSGNRILKELLREPGSIQPRIKHFGAMGLEGEVEGEIRNGRTPYIILLIRNTHCLKASIAKHYRNWTRTKNEKWTSVDHAIATHWQATLRVERLPQTVTAVTRIASRFICLVGPFTVRSQLRRRCRR